MGHDGHSVGGRATMVQKWEQWSQDLPGDALAAALANNEVGVRNIIEQMKPENAKALALACATIAGVAAAHAGKGGAGRHLPAEVMALARRAAYGSKRKARDDIRVHGDDEQMELF